MFDGSHETHPLISGEPLFANPKLPGWSSQPEFLDPRQIPYGPLPREHGHFKGLYLHHNRVILSYSVGTTSVLEMPGLERAHGLTAFSRELDLKSLSSELFLQVAASPREGERILALDGRALSQDAEAGESIAVLGEAGQITAAAVVGAPPGTRWLTDRGRIRLQLPTISAARLKLLIWSGARSGARISRVTGLLQTASISSSPVSSTATCGPITGESLPLTLSSLWPGFIPAWIDLRAPS